MGDSEVSKLADWLAKFIITSLSVIIFPIWMMAENRTGLDNYIADHSLKIYWLSWQSILILVPLIFLGSYYALVLIAKDRSNKRTAFFLRFIFFVVLLVILGPLLTYFTVFPNSFDRAEFNNVLGWFVLWTYLSIVIASDPFIKQWLERQFNRIKTLKTSTRPNEKNEANAKLGSSDRSLLRGDL